MNRQVSTCPTEEIYRSAHQWLSRVELADQLCDGFGVGVFYDADGSAVGGVVHFLLVDVEGAANRGVELAYLNRVFVDLLAAFGAGADELASPDSAARDGCTPHPRPMVATVVAVDFRCSAKLAAEQDERGIEQVEATQVGDEGAVGLVEVGAEVGDGFEVVVVRIPTRKCDLDETDTDLHESAGEQASLSEEGDAVAFAHFGRFLFEIEGGHAR